MEQLELAAVISDAARLHTQLTSAIDRCLTTKRASAEAWSLASIRDVLEVLEDQLRCLESLPHQLKAERTATLAEIEESRCIFLRRLKQHQGCETDVIREALDFAGEPVQKQDKIFPEEGSVGEDHSAVPHKIMVQEKAMDHDLSSMKAIRNLIEEDMGGFMSRDGTEQMYSIMSGYEKDDADTMYDSFGDEILQCMLKDGTGQLYRVMAADPRHGNVISNRFGEELRECMLEEDVQVQEGDQKHDNRQGGIFGRIKSRIGTFLNGRFVKLSACILLTAAGATAMVALSNSARGRHDANGVRRRGIINSRFAVMNERHQRDGNRHELLHV